MTLAEGKVCEAVTDPPNPDRDKIESCLEKARIDLLATLDALRTGTLSEPVNLVNGFYCSHPEFSRTADG